MPPMVSVAASPCSSTGNVPLVRAPPPAAEPSGKPASYTVAAAEPAAGIWLISGVLGSPVAVIVNSELEVSPSASVMV